MKHLLVLPILIFVMGNPAAAAIKGCYERYYDGGVLKRHPGQLVTAVALTSGIPPNDQEGFEDSVSFKFRGGKTVEVSSYSCTDGKSELTCKLTDWNDGSKGGRGRFTLTETKDGVILRPMVDLVLAPFDGAKPVTLKVTGNPDHNVFTLSRTNVDMESCGAK